MMFNTMLKIFNQKPTLFFIIWLSMVTPLVTLAQASDSFTVRQYISGDTEVPTTPTPFSVTSLSSSQIDITWGASTDNTSVSGYRLFRETEQIATTTLLTYSDTGLTPNTTYTYFVRAFDLSGNVSSSSVSLSATTDAVIDDTNLPQSSVLPPRLTAIDIDEGTESARLSFATVQPVTYTLRYGITDALTDGFVQSDLFKKEHSTILNGLEPFTKYLFELYGTDRFGRQVLLEKGSFTTLSRYELPPVSNVTFFIATVSNLDVVLKWGNPMTEAFAYVRVVRNHYYYPQYPSDGLVIYEGTAESLYDESALSTYDRQYYTVFAYNIDGVPSSGAIATVLKNQVGSSGINQTPVNDQSVSSPDDNETITEPFRLTFADVTVIQSDILIPATAENILLNTTAPFMIRIPTALLPSTTKTIIATWQHPFEAIKKTSYLMKRNQAGTFFEAIAAPMLDTGLYPLKLTVFDGSNNELGFVSGRLELVTTIDSQVVTEPVSYVTTGYIIVGSLIGLLTVLGTWLLMLFLLQLLMEKKYN